jgi:hypothetical protein
MIRYKNSPATGYLDLAQKGEAMRGDGRLEYKLGRHGRLPPKLFYYRKFRGEPPVPPIISILIFFFNDNNNGNNNIIIIIKINKLYSVEIV